MPECSPTPTQRLKLCNIMFGNIQNIEISTDEMAQNGANYTVDTVQRLQARYPNAQITVALGGDMLLALHQWYDVKLLCQLVDFAVLSREENINRDDIALQRQATYMQATYQAKITLVPHDPIEAGSYALRQQLMRGEDSPLLSPVMTYIDTHNLYRHPSKRLSIAKIEQLVREILSPKRWQHSLGTAETAADLARCHGVNEDDAYRAGLWHDFTKEENLQKQLQICHSYGIMSSVDENLNLLHSYSSACLAFDVYGESRAVAMAIAAHVCGQIGMSQLAKCAYLADKTEPGRNYPEVTALRDLSRHDLDAAMVATLEQIMQWHFKRGGIVYPQSITTRNFLLNQ